VNTVLIEPQMETLGGMTGGNRSISLRAAPDCASNGAEFLETAV
jgi:hypothetical protein